MISICNMCSLLYLFKYRFDENLCARSRLHTCNRTPDILCLFETSCWHSRIPAICVSKLGNRFLYSSSCFTLQSHRRTFPYPLTPSLHYTPDSSVSKTLWQRESHRWPLKFPATVACHACIVELWCQGFRFHTITTHRRHILSILKHPSRPYALFMSSSLKPEPWISMRCKHSVLKQ